MDTYKTNRFNRTVIAAALAATLVGGNVLGMSAAHTQYHNPHRPQQDHGNQDLPVSLS